MFDKLVMDGSKEFTNVSVEKSIEFKNSVLSEVVFKQYLEKYSGAKNWSAHLLPLSKKEIEGYEFDYKMKLDNDSAKRYMFKSVLNSGKDLLVMALVVPGSVELEFYAGNSIYKMLGLMKNEELEQQIKKQFNL